ncbi:MAG: Phosphate-specific transport system accessory protein PhoU [Caldanaerobacter subterraneus]|uniref:Phosphate-specific transport system accessory protein PhoU n=2 Tax=Thermoanaerobacter TaxID=1754 RepID=B0K8M5_THEP3|nr:MULTISPECIES: phosphate signaling complex protein PhoU [Thermoanaerobacter]KUK35139.1 MAG: Phosphate-specific transport system accessory protein PhoU [Caldanaerobacter subterraneus]ABY93263.1 phosphate uptake regulator, PhoU [Thermoanaerobacter sp. X514]ABY94488.1 phosphate uptake regulator, PhoU [Thermoanaerobacter pseudethanolicus ATCC 33223]ADV79441.1 phosphate transport system regulatory protein PhoU [Thermoanaerobacter brockii subsp. finnii Ako-1]MDI3501669.1 phosphate transport system
MNRTHFEKELEELHYDVLKMGSLVEEAIANSIASLVNHDTELAQKVIDDDDRIDKIEVEIDNKCAKIIVTQQPIARDLRIVLTGLKIVTDLERMADHAVDIAKTTLRIAHQNYIKPLIDIPRMAEIVREMVKMSLDSYVRQDLELARAIGEKDDIVDALYKQIFRELLTYMMEDPRNIDQATQFLFVARYLERIADHATNICEWVIYLDTGEHIDLN